MKKINELVTSSEKPEHKAKRKAITFGSFKRAEEKQIAERKEQEHQLELARISKEARIIRALEEEEKRVIREEDKRKRKEFITNTMSNAFGTKTELDYKPVREQVIDKYLPQLREQETLGDHPKPFVAEPALNAELAEFKKKINEHLHKIGFASTSGGGAGSFADLDDVDPTTAKVNGKTIQFDSSTNKFVGADVTAGALAADNLTAGDAAINLTTTVGNITIDAQGNNTDIIFKGTDGSSDTTFLTIDGSEAGAATFNAGLVIADAGNIGSASDTDAIAIASTGVVTMNQIPVFSAGINVSGGSIAGTLSTAAQTNITSVGTLSGLVIANDGNIGSASDTDSATIDSSGNWTIGQNLTVTGNFTVNGTTTTVSTTNMKVSDTLLELNTGAGSNANDMGIIMERGSTGNNAIFMFDESADEFTVGTTTATNDATGNITITTGTFTAATLKGNLVVADDGDIGSASATDAMQISSAGIVTFKDDILLKDACTIGTATTAGAIAIAADGTVDLATAGATVNSTAINVAGTQTIWVPAAAMRPTSSNGCAAITDVETTAGRPDLQVLDFDTSADEHAQFQVGFPKSWNAGTITFRVFWTSTATDTDGVAWGLQGVSVANDSTIDVAYGTAVVVTDDNISAAEDCLVTSTSSAVTIASAAADTMTFFRIFRDVSDANDDMAEDARLLGVQIFFTTNAANDA